MRGEAHRLAERDQGRHADAIGGDRAARDIGGMAACGQHADENAGLVDAGYRDVVQVAKPAPAGEDGRADGVEPELAVGEGGVLVDADFVHTGPHLLDIGAGADHVRHRQGPVGVCRRHRPAPCGIVPVTHRLTTPRTDEREVYANE
ncbi:MAG: hypothetical protein HC829_00030 [Bacteroidales bacterium]|nr:hypothetical protein [Bacteroidales bacterium]